MSVFGASTPARRDAPAKLRGPLIRAEERIVNAPLDLDNPAHLDALKQAYARFPEIGGRAAP